MKSRPAVIVCVLVLILVLAFLGLREGEAPEAVLPAEDASTASLTLAPQTVVLPDGTEATFRIAEPFRLTVAAEGLGKARFMAISPDGRLFVPDLVNYRLSHEGKVFILEGFDETTGRFATTHTYLSGLRGPNSVAFYTDEAGKHWLYLALTKELLRYPYRPGDTEPSGEPEVVASFPDTQAPGETSVVWHITRTVLFHGDRLYVAIGSGCNSCEQPEGELRGMILSMAPDGSDVQVYADGLRNAVGLEWGAEGALFATANGVDHLGSDAPDETMYRIVPGEHYGWPYCYELDGALVEDSPERWNDPVSCQEAPRSFVAFEPRSAPLGVTYFADANPLLEGSFLVALHGSFEPEMGAGYQVMRVGRDGRKDVFMDGFLSETLEQLGRPVHFLQRDRDSFFMTDDHTGRIYFVHVAS